MPHPVLQKHRASRLDLVQQVLHLGHCCTSRCCLRVLVVQVSDVVRQVYGMPPAQVVQKARACKDSHTNTAKPVP